MYFIRSVAFVNMYQQVLALYGKQTHQLSIPKSVFNNMMTLVPFSELNTLYRELESLTADPDFVIKTVSSIRHRELGAIGRWMFSGHDLASTIRRVNFGSQCLQSGCSMAGTQIGNLIKWRYTNKAIDSDVKVHDSVRVAAFMLNIMRIYLGNGFTPIRVQLSGRRSNISHYQSYFGCEVSWNHPSTEIWFHSNARLSSNQNTILPKASLAMSLQELDEFLNMPQPDDELKVVYELIQYSCHYGVPKVGRVAQFLNVSEQKFQRKLRQQDLNFSTLSAYVMTNIASHLLLEPMSISSIAKRLGYHNVDSFNRMFKKHRGVTPLQYRSMFANEINHYG